VVTVESPALCPRESPTQLLLAYLEILKTLVKGGKPERIRRITDAIKDRASPDWQEINTELSKIASRQQDSKNLRNLIFGAV